MIVIDLQTQIKHIDSNNTPPFNNDPEPDIGTMNNLT